MAGWVVMAKAVASEAVVAGRQAFFFPINLTVFVERLAHQAMVNAGGDRTKLLCMLDRNAWSRSL